MSSNFLVPSLADTRKYVERIVSQPRKTAIVQSKWFVWYYSERERKTTEKLQKGQESQGATGFISINNDDYNNN